MCHFKKWKVFHNDAIFAANNDEQQRGEDVDDKGKLEEQLEEQQQRVEIDPSSTDRV